MAINMVAFPPEAVKDYLAADKKTQAVKKYELLLALILHGFMEIKLGEVCAIGFELDEKYFKNGLNGTVSLTEIEAMLSEQVRQGSEIDIGITCGTKTMPFQLKRFGVRKQVSVQDFVQYINVDIKKQYGTKAFSSQTRLVLCLECEGELDIAGAIPLFNMVDFPFKSLMYISMDSSDHHIQVGEFWPNQGCDDYEIVNGKLQLMDN